MLRHFLSGESREQCDYWYWDGECLQNHFNWKWKFEWLQQIKQKCNRQLIVKFFTLVYIVFIKRYISWFHYLDKKFRASWQLTVKLHIYSVHTESYSCSIRQSLMIDIGRKKSLSKIHSKYTINDIAFVSCLH